MRTNDWMNELELVAKSTYCKRLEELTVTELHDVLGRTVMGELADDWRESKQKNENRRRAYYFSAEFLMGRMVYNNLYALGILEEVRELLQRKGIDLNQLEEIEDAALGNGGLGRLAACFLDSAATHDIPLDGYGIRYKDGLFKQRFENGFQAESADDWQRFGDPWSIRRNSDIVQVRFADQTVNAVPYDMAVIGYGRKHIGTLRLWQSEPLEEFDFTLFNEQRYAQAVEKKNAAENISRVLYPNDSTDDGKRLRLKQQYFFCSASLQDILKRYQKQYGHDYRQFAPHCAIQLNDTHPTVAIPELIRLLKQEGFAFEEAFSIAQKTFAYTNHTIMAEALEKWSIQLFQSVLPELYDIIVEIDARLVKDLRPSFPLPEPVPVKREKVAGKAGTAEKTEEDALNKTAGAVKKTQSVVAKAESEEEPQEEPEIEYEPVVDPLDPMRILSGGLIHMARLAIYASSYVNGVARIHTEILKNDALKAWYAVYPERFQNKTNGITQRRWLGLCNPELSAFITSLIGDQWVTDLAQLRKLEQHMGDETIARFNAIKQEKKRQLSAYLQKQEGVYVDPSFVFDIQVKRLHEYKRQLLNAFSIVAIYFRLKEGRLPDFHPTAFLFGAKAAPGYFRAKGIIKYINEIARRINEDPQVNQRLKVLFVSNYNVSYAEKLVTAADISEQISTAGTEASGTGNMKLMLNGTVTLGTYDGANVEIVEQAGEENNYIFGARVEELNQLRDTYCPKALYEENPEIKRVLDTLIDGTFDDGGTGMFRELYTSILEGASWHRPDHYFLLQDLPSYVETKLRAISDYRDRISFGRKCFRNTAGAGMFSSDRTIQQYAEELWRLSGSGKE